MPHLRRPLAWIAAALLLGGCKDVVTTPAPAGPDPLAPPSTPLGAGAAGTLQWFGYVDGANDEYSLNGQDSYTNFGFVATNENPSSTHIASRVAALSRHGQAAIVELGKLLWCGTGYATLCPGVEGRLSTWKAANASILTGGKVLGWIVRDEPTLAGVTQADWERAAKLVRDSLPGPKILLIEYAGVVADAGSSFNQDKTMQTVDWVGVDIYNIHPRTNGTLSAAIANLKTRFPGRGIVYVGDGFFNSSHQAAFGTTDINVMRGIATEWYDVARADPAAVLLGFFIWENVEGGKGSRNFPPYVLQEHTRIGREITLRARGRAYAPTGALKPLFNDGIAAGYACDPDAAWGEVVRVDFFTNGRLAGSATADRYSIGTYSGCRSGNHREFRAQLSGQLGSVVTAVAYDLDGGSTTLPSSPSAQVAWVQPSGASWGPPNTLTAAGWARNGSGGVIMEWRDVTFSSNPPWNRVSYAPAPNAADASWSNTIPSDNYCHVYQVRAIYAGSSSPTFGWNGRYSGYCNETARMIWIQPSSTAGFGSPGSLVVAGEAEGAPSGTLVAMWYRNVTLGGGWVKKDFEAATDANGIWLNDIPNANPLHQYAVYAKYDVVTTSTCTYAGGNSITWC